MRLKSILADVVFIFLRFLIYPKLYYFYSSNNPILAFLLASNDLIRIIYDFSYSVDAGTFNYADIGYYFK